MSAFFCKLFTPWRAKAHFDGPQAFHTYLLRYNRVLNAIRNVTFGCTAICLIVAYMYDQKLLNYAGVGFLLIALAVTLVCSQNEKQLPEEFKNL